MKFFIVLMLLCLNVHAEEGLLQKGAQLYEQRADVQKVHEALALFQKQIELDPSSAEAHWRAAMAHYYIGHLIKGNQGRKQRKEHFQAGIDHATKCVELTKGNLVDCHFWLGTNVALLAQEKGLLSMAFGLKGIFKHFERCKELNANYASGGPYRMLALLSHKAPGFLGGDTKKAYEYIREAIKNSPNEPLNIYFLAKFLVDDDKEAEALKLINDFIANAKTENFAFYESHNAFKNLKHFVAKKEWLEED